MRIFLYFHESIEKTNRNHNGSEMIITEDFQGKD